MSEKKQKLTVPIRSETGRLQAIQAVRDAEIPINMTLETEQETRRLKQNRLAFKWYSELGNQTGEGKEYWRCFCKLHHGVPILREDPEVNAKFAAVLDPLPYEAQLDAMEFIDVTSLMSVKQFSEYLNEVDMSVSLAGVKLTHPDDLYWDALMKGQKP